MQDLKMLEKRGATHKKFQAFFTAKDKDTIAKRKRLQELHADRLRRAIDTNLIEAPIYGAIDNALNTAQDNLPGIQARQLAGSGKTNEEIIQLMQQLKLNNLLEPVYKTIDGADQLQYQVVNGRKEPMLTINKPLFDEVFVPLVASYVSIRVGKLYNDRNTYPRYKYSPPRLTMDDMLISDIVTNRVQRMTSDMGYADDDKQSIHQMAAYGICFNFPKESYFSETYETVKDGKDVEKVKREGVRFVIPHPTRHFWDRSCPLYTFNSDTGVEYAGYWDILKWGDIKDNPLYWNTDKITYGGYDLFTTETWKIYSTLYPCVIKTPQGYSKQSAVNNPDRISKEQDNYLKDEHDSSVTLAVIFDKIKPSDYGLFDYDKPVWMRFVYANFDTCIHCEVVPYTPGYVYLCNYDANQTVAKAPGLTLIPFAQLLGNFITQHFISVKQNLMRVNWVNTDIMPAEQINLLKRAKDKIYQGIQWLLYSKKQNAFQIGERGDQRDAVTTMQTPQVDIQQLAGNVNLTLMAVERMLGFSPQEVGSPASHEQSATEVSVTSANSSVNLEFMGTGIDSAWVSKKRLLYTAFYCYGSDEVFAEVADLTPERKVALEKLGFEVEEGEYGSTHAGVKGKKGALTLDSFMSDREGVTRLNDSKLGIAMLQNLGSVAGNQMLFERVGADGFLKLFNYVWRMVGLPEDFRLKPSADSAAANPQAQQQEFLQILEQAKQQIVENAVQVVGQQMQEQIIKPVTDEFMAVKQALEQGAQKDAATEAVLQQMVGAIKELQAVAAQAMQPQPPQQVPVPVPVPVPVDPNQMPIDPALTNEPIPNGPIGVIPAAI